jgi:flagellar hook-length control protein FliK
MQILDLLGSTASTAKVPQADLTSQKDAFAKHLNEVMDHRNQSRTDDARRHSERSENIDEVRPDQEERVEEVSRDEKPEDIEEEVSAAESRDKSPEESEVSNKQGESADATNVVAQATAQDLSEIVAANPAVVEAGSADIRKVVSDDQVLGQASEDMLETVVVEENTGIVAALDSAHKASQNAAFNNNNKARASEVADDRAGPFEASSAIDPFAVHTEVNLAVEVSEVVAEVVSEQAIKTDISDLSDDTQVVSQVASQTNIQQAKGAGDDRANRGTSDDPANRAVGYVKDKADPVIAETPLIRDAKIAVGPDDRLIEMKIAQALVEEAAAENIHARFMLGNGTGTTMAALNQVSATQAGNIQEQVLSTGQPKPQTSPQVDGDSELPLSGQLSARPESAPRATPQVSQPVPGQNGLANMDPNALNSLSERAASTLAQMTTQAAQGDAVSRPAQAQPLASAAMGAEMAGNAAGNSTSSAPVTPLAEVGASNGTQMANAAKPVAPPPPPTQQPPQAQVAMHIAKAVQNGTDKISIRLNPAELGRVDIKLEVARDGAVTASIIVERPETLELLKGDARSLERALANAGLDPDSDNLSFNLRDQNSNGSSFAKNANGDGKGSANGQDDGQNAQADDDDIDVEALLAEARANAAHNRALDINV